MAGKPLHGRYYSRPNSGPRVKFKQGPKSWKRRFIGEMKRTNNVLAALKFAHITWECYQEWVSSGFLSAQEIKDAETIFHQRHPKMDIIVKHSDQTLEDEGYAVAPVEAVGYDERSILGDDGWIDSPDWTDDL